VSAGRATWQRSRERYLVRNCTVNFRIAIFMCAAASRGNHAVPVWTIRAVSGSTSFDEATRPSSCDPHAFDLLVAFVERSDELITKDELLKRVWCNISAIRKAVGANAIATVTGRGYRFVPEVLRVPTTPAPLALARRHNLPTR
jgi:DNA-binding response OmpR family regulator